MKSLFALFNGSGNIFLKSTNPVKDAVIEKQTAMKQIIQAGVLAWVT
ncbi:hypothetical protein [Polynucleobacter necessarius]|nr:hypothetical protein [Polynucleobacter necessarius]